MALTHCTASGAQGLRRPGPAAPHLVNSHLQFRFRHTPAPLQWARKNYDHLILDLQRRAYEAALHMVAERATVIRTVGAELCDNRWGAAAVWGLRCKAVGARSARTCEGAKKGSALPFLRRLLSWLLCAGGPAALTRWLWPALALPPCDGVSLTPTLPLQPPTPPCSDETVLGSRIVELLKTTPKDKVPEDLLASLSGGAAAPAAAAAAAAGPGSGAGGDGSGAAAAQQPAAAAVATAVAERAASGAAASSSGRGGAEEAREALGQDIYGDPALVALAEVVSSRVSAAWEGMMGRLSTAACEGLGSRVRCAALAALAAAARIAWRSAAVCAAGRVAWPRI